MKITALMICSVFALTGLGLAQEKSVFPESRPDELIRAVKSSRKDRALALEKVKMLVKQGADVNYADRYGVTPLGYAADIGDLEITRFLWSKGAKHEAGKERPLIVAAGRGRLDIVRFYIDNGVPPNTISGQGNTALQVAVRSGQAEVVEYLRSKKQGK